jgi:hypothetical protein
MQAAYNKTQYGEMKVDPVKLDKYRATARKSMNAANLRNRAAAPGKLGELQELTVAGRRILPSHADQGYVRHQGAGGLPGAAGALQEVLKLKINPIVYKYADGTLEEVAAPKRRAAPASAAAPKRRRAA